jgi:hypothetical protein
VTVAALYVQKSGCYYGLPGVDPWDAERDARLYAGPHPVVAHPPCNRWAMPLAKVNETRYGHKVGDDDGCFEAALNAVRTWGGVLEHPANTAAWKAFGLPKPVRGRWWPASCGGWVCQVSQCAYGHPCRKRTWLYYVGSRPPELDWSEPPPRAVTSWLQRTNTKLPRITKKEACKTPIPFRDALLSMARSARREAA